MKIRSGKPSDFDNIMAVMNHWWGGRQVDHLQHELFFDHFTDTIFIAEDENGKMIGFINGFYSQVNKEVAYVHFIGVAPEFRENGLGRVLYDKFFEKCLLDNRIKVQACTSKVNMASIRFHEKLGFRSWTNDTRNKVQFEKVLI